MPSPITQGDSFAFFLGDGASTTFPLGYDYLDAAHINVLVNGSAQANPDDFTVIGTDVVFDTAPANATDVRLIRTTDRDYDARLVDFRAFGSITEDEMDLNQKQIWFLIQEAMETDDSGNANPNAEYISWDSIQSRWTALRGGVNQKIGDLADPSTGDEAATKDYVDSIAEWGIAGVPQAWSFNTVIGQSSYVMTDGYLLDPNYLIVSINGVIQVPLVDFTVSQGNPSSTLILTTAPTVDDQIISVLNFGKTRFINITTLGPNTVASENIQPGAVDTSDLADDSVTENKLADDAVTADKIAALAVSAAKIADDAVNFDKLNSVLFDTAPGGGVDHVMKIVESTGALIHEPMVATDISDIVAWLATQPVSGLGPATAYVDMGGEQIKNLATPTLSTDAATKDYVDSAGSTGTKTDLLASYTLGSATQTWTLFTSPPAWFTDSTYLYYEFVCNNWLWPGGGSDKVLLRFYQSGGWREDYFLQGQLQTVADFPTVWSCFISNPRSGAVKPVISSTGGQSNVAIWDRIGWTPVLYGEADGVSIRVEGASSIPIGATFQVYGRRAF